MIAKQPWALLMLRVAWQLYIGTPGRGEPATATPSVSAAEVRAPYVQPLACPPTRRQVIMAGISPVRTAFCSPRHPASAYAVCAPNSCILHLSGYMQRVGTAVGGRATNQPPNLPLHQQPVSSISHACMAPCQVAAGLASSCGDYTCTVFYMLYYLRCLQAQLLMATSPQAFDARSSSQMGGFSAVGQVKDQGDCNTCVRSVMTSWM